MDFEPSAKAKDYVARVRDFMREHIFPAEFAVLARRRG